MAFNENFLNKFTFQNNFTSQPNFSIPPPPLRYTPPSVGNISDEEYVKKYEHKMHFPPQKKTKPISLIEVQSQLKNILYQMRILSEKEKILRENIDSISDEVWNNKMNEIHNNKVLIDRLMMNINDTYLESIKKVLAKRASKRMRLKRVRNECKMLRDKKYKEWEEKSRKIDENLQKIKDTIIKTKQEEESKIQTDIILREVTRKKQDAKKCIEKLNALVQLHRARENTLKGRGLTVPVAEAQDFNDNISKLKALWIEKLSSYEKEEVALRTKLQEENCNKETKECETDKAVTSNLKKWRKFLFGSNCNPQVDFKDVQEFISVRSQWDSYIHEEGSPLPIGWVTPQ